MDRSIYLNRKVRGGFEETTTKIAGFWKLKRTGVRLPVNPYRWYRYDAVHPTSTSDTGTVNELDVAQAYTPLQFVTTGSDTRGNRCSETIGSSVNQVSSRLLSKVRETKIDLGVALGEYRETAQFVSSAMKKTARSMNQLRKGDVSGALKTLTGERNNKWRDIPNVASNTWLAYSYGLRPLIKDVYDAIQVLDKGYQHAPDPITVRSGHYFDVYIKERPMPYVEGKSSLTAGYNIHVSVKGGVNFYVDNPLLRTLDQCGVINPLSVAWELVPYSFVVDWFIPIGRYISNIVPPQGVAFVDGYISTKMFGTSHQTTNRWHQSTAMEWKEVLKQRIRLSTFPSYRVVVPDVSLEKSQIASGLALLWQQLPSKSGGSLRL